MDVPGDSVGPVSTALGVRERPRDSGPFTITVEPVPCKHILSWSCRAVPDGPLADVLIESAALVSVVPPVSVITIGMAVVSNVELIGPAAGTVIDAQFPAAVWHGPSAVGDEIATEPPDPAVEIAPDDSAGVAIPSRASPASANPPGTLMSLLPSIGDPRQSHRRVRLGLEVHSWFDAEQPFAALFRIVPGHVVGSRCHRGNGLSLGRTICVPWRRLLASQSPQLTDEHGRRDEHDHASPCQEEGFPPCGGVIPHRGVSDEWHGEPGFIRPRSPEANGPGIGISVGVTLSPDDVAVGRLRHGDDSMDVGVVRLPRRMEEHDVADLERRSRDALHGDDAAHR